MSEIKYSTGGTPYIELTEGDKNYGKIVFSKLTSVDTGYKWICFSHRYTNQVVSKKGKGKKATHTFTELLVNDSYVFNMKMKRSEDGKKGVPQGMMPRRLVDWLIALFAEFTIDDIMPFSAIKHLEPIIADLNIEEVLVSEVERVRKAKAKIRKQRKLDKIAAEDRAKVEEKIIQDDYRENNGVARKAKHMTTVNLSEIF